MAESRFETLNAEEIAVLLNHKDSKKIEISLIFKFRMFELKFAAKIIVCCDFAICYRTQ